MRLGFLVNRMETEKARYTTTLLAMMAARRGHEVYRMDVSSLSCEMSTASGTELCMR